MPEQETSLMPLSDSQREALEEATSAYAAGVTRAVASKLQARGIDKDTALTFRVGVVTDNPFPGHDRFRGWIALPYLDANGAPKTIRFRCPEDHDCREHGHGKYMTLPDDPSRLFNVGAIKRAGEEIHIAEGEFDAMVLTRCGYHAVAVPGVQNWKSHFRRLVAGFNRVWVWADADDAGADMARKITQQVRSAKAVRLPRGMDVTDTYLAGGASALAALID